METDSDRLQRFLEFLPGFLLWIMLLSPIWAGLSIPYIVINFLVVLSVYWLYRAIFTAIGVALGYRQYKIDSKKDWLEECLSLKNVDLPNPEELPEGLLPKYLIVIAHYGEEYEVLKRSIDGLVNQNYPRELIYLSVSIEGRKAKKDEVYAKREEQLRADFGDFFGDRLMVFTHPDDIPGEAIGAASNRTWGTRNAVEELERRGEDISKILITAPDGDLVFSKDYLAASVYKWLINEKRNKRFYQTAMYKFSNNYWDVPALIRIITISLTLPVLASSIMEKDKRETWSCYTLNLKLMKDVDYWDTSLGIDDTTFYWRPYFHLHGDWSCEVFFASLSADAIYEISYLKNHQAQYKQYLRWGWGVISVPLAIKILISSELKVTIFERIMKIFHLFEVFVFWKVFAFLIAFGLPIVFLLNSNNSLINQTLIYTVPTTVSAIMSLTVILLVPSTLYKFLIVPPRPNGMSKFKFVFLMLIEIPLNIVSLFTFSFVPFIEATTRMMLGQKHTKTIKWAEKSIATK